MTSVGKFEGAVVTFNRFVSVILSGESILLLCI